MNNAIISPDLDAAYHARDEPDLRLVVIRVGWCNDGGGGRAFPVDVAGYLSDGRVWGGTMDEFWDRWIHEDLIESRKEHV